MQNGSRLLARWVSIPVQRMRSALGRGGSVGAKLSGTGARTPDLSPGELRSLFGSDFDAQGAAHRARSPAASRAGRRPVEASVGRG